MKFSVIVALSIAALASAQVPKGTPKASGSPKGAPKGGQCAAQCLMAPLQNAGCKLTGLFPKGGAGGAGGFPKGGAGGLPKGGAGGLPKPASGGAGGMAGMPGMNMLVARQDATAPKPTSPPKISISPEQQAAIASARSCFCAAPALKSAAENCVPSACATAADAGAGAVKMINGMCKGVAGFAPLTAPPAPAAAPAAPTPA